MAKEGTQLSPPHCGALTAPQDHSSHPTDALTLQSQTQHCLAVAILVPRATGPPSWAHVTALGTLPGRRWPWDVAGCGMLRAQHPTAQQPRCTSLFIPILFITKIKAQTVETAAEQHFLSNSKGSNKKDHEHSKHTRKPPPNTEHPCAYPNTELQLGKHMAEHKAFLPALSPGPDIREAALDSTQV